MAASETAISAGCAFSVSVSVSAGPSHMMVAELLAERRIDLVEHLRAPAQKRRPAPCPCRPPGCPGREKRMQSPCFTLQAVNDATRPVKPPRNPRQASAGVRKSATRCVVTLDQQGGRSARLPTEISDGRLP